MTPPPFAPALHEARALEKEQALFYRVLSAEAEAQGNQEDIEALNGAGCCLMLATALHSIAVGNLLPARVRTICVDMVESVPVKLGNRGTMQAIGLVTDVGFFLERLAAELETKLS